MNVVARVVLCLILKSVCQHTSARRLSKVSEIRLTSVTRAKRAVYWWQTTLFLTEMLILLNGSVILDFQDVFLDLIEKNLFPEYPT